MAISGPSAELQFRSALPSKADIREGTAKRLLMTQLRPSESDSQTGRNRNSVILAWSANACLDELVCGSYEPRTHPLNARSFSYFSYYAFMNTEILTQSIVVMLGVVALWLVRDIFKEFIPKQKLQYSQQLA